MTATAALAGTTSSITDTLVFGDAASESAHHFADTRSETISGGLGESARRLLAPAVENWEGGRMSFTLAVDPVKQNYASVRLWGSDATRDRLALFCEGKQIGYRHLGDIDLLDIGGGAAAFPGRFVFNTTPLPLAMTRGKTNLNLEIRGSGQTWAYADTFEKYQKPMTEPTRGIYEIYSHTNGFFSPPENEKHGIAPQNPQIRTLPGPEVLDKLKARVNGQVASLLKSAKPLTETEMQFLARAYFVKWTPAFQNPKVIAQVVKGVDALALAFRKNPELAHNDVTASNPGWFEFGPAGQAISLLGDELKPLLDGPVDGGDKTISRRVAWSQLLVAGRDWHRRHRRLYTNQTMITDLNIYLSNRGLEVVDPTNALSEAAVRRYLYEAVGLEPWRDSDVGTDSHRWDVGENYFQLTAKALTKELGYVGYYGEVLDWMTKVYDATRPTVDQPGDKKIRDQLARAGHARGIFRYPAVDDDGNRAMRIETVVGWRDDEHYPGDVSYAERPGWDGSPLGWVTATLDPTGIGYAQQMFADNQFFASLSEQLKLGGLRVTAGLLPVPEQCELVQAQSPQPARLPMTPGQPDSVFSDEEDGVVAVKNGGEIFYASLYWRARNAVNFLARTHFTTPAVDRIAVVQEDVQFTPSGEFYTRPDHINFGFANGGPKFPGELHSAHAGEKLPIAKIPDGVKFKSGDESVYAGKGDFYTLRYGDYLVGMNMTTDRTFELKTPAEIAVAKELVSGKTIQLGAPLPVAPRSTVVLFFGK